MTYSITPWGQGSYGGDVDDGSAPFPPTQDGALGVSSTTIQLRVLIPGVEDTLSIKWDSTGQRKYATGIDRGVLYLSDGTAVPWNGLTSVVENQNRNIAHQYFDGMKISTVISLGDYTGSLKAFTFPDEFEELQGLGKFIDGVFLGEQPIQPFDLSYRTMVGDDLHGPDASYKIHILFNVLALPKDMTYATTTDSPTFTEFEWDISAVQQEVDGHTPTAHIIIDSDGLSRDFLDRVESLIYGDEFTFAKLPTLPEFIIFLQNLSAEVGVTLLTIVDNGDGTWTATTDEDDLISVNEDGTFEIFNANATFDGDSIDISNTVLN